MCARLAHTKKGAAGTYKYRAAPDHYYGIYTNKRK